MRHNRSGERAGVNDMLRQLYGYVAENTTQAVVTAILVFLAVYWATGLVWPVALVAVVGMGLVAYGAGLEEIDNMDDVELKK